MAMAPYMAADHDIDTTAAKLNAAHVQTSLLIIIMIVPLHVADVKLKTAWPCMGARSLGTRLG